MNTLKNNSQKILIAIIIALAIGVLILMFLLLYNKEELRPKSSTNNNAVEKENEESITFVNTKLKFEDCIEGCESQTAKLGDKEVVFSIKDVNLDEYDDEVFVQGVYLDDKLVFKPSNPFYSFYETIDIINDIFIISERGLNYTKIYVYNSNGDVIKTLEKVNSFYINQAGALDPNSFYFVGYKVEDNKITMKTSLFKPSQDGLTTVYIDDSKSIDICSNSDLQQYNINSTTLVAAEYEINYLGNNKFSDPTTVAGTEVTFDKYLEDFNCN